MRVLGIDHGTKTGWVLLEDGYFKACGKIIVEGKDIPTKFRMYQFELRQLIGLLQPDYVALEEPKHRLNAKTVNYLIGLYSIALLVCGMLRRKPVEVNPKHMKLVITGSGNAEKSVVAATLADLYNLPITDLVEYEYYKKKGKEGQIKDAHYDISDAFGLAYVAWREKKEQSV